MYKYEVWIKKCPDASENYPSLSYMIMTDYIFTFFMKTENMFSLSSSYYCKNTVADTNTRHSAGIFSETQNIKIDILKYHIVFFFFCL